MRHFLTFAFASALLVGCADAPKSPVVLSTAAASSKLDYAQIAAGAQQYYPAIRAAALLYAGLPGAQPAIVASITKLQPSLDAEVGALSATTAPTTVRAVVQDLGVLADALPTTKLAGADANGVAAARLFLAVAQAMLPSPALATPPIAAVPAT